MDIRWIVLAVTRKYQTVGGLREQVGESIVEQGVLMAPDSHTAARRARALFGHDLVVMSLLSWESSERESLGRRRRIMRQGARPDRRPKAYTGPDTMWDLTVERVKP